MFINVCVNLIWSQVRQNIFLCFFHSATLVAHSCGVTINIFVYTQYKVTENAGGSFLRVGPRFIDSVHAFLNEFNFPGISLFAKALLHKDYL